MASPQCGGTIMMMGGLTSMFLTTFIPLTIYTVIMVIRPSLKSLKTLWPIRHGIQWDLISLISITTGFLTT